MSNKEIVTREYLIFDGNKGYVWKNGNTYRLVVCATTCQTAEGDLICSWMSGTGGEPEAGHCAMFSRSVDFGKTWSEPQMFVTPGEVNGTGAIIEMDAQLYALSARWPLEKLYSEHHYTVSESDDGGYTWYNEHPINFWKDGINASYGAVLKLKDGSWIGLSQINFSRKKRFHALAAEIACVETEEAAYALPVNDEVEPGDLEGYKDKHWGIGAFRCDKHFDHMEYLGSFSNRPLGLIEPTIVELSDGRLSVLCRAELGGFMWRSDSSDAGHTWCDAYETDISCASGLARAIRLPDDRIVLFLNPLGEKGKRGSRNELAVWVSDDDMKTWYLKKTIATGGYLSYPNPILLKNGQLAISFDDRRHARYIEVDLPPKRKSFNEKTEH